MNQKTKSPFHQVQIVSVWQNLVPVLLTKIFYYTVQSGAYFVLFSYSNTFFFDNGFSFRTIFSSSSVSE